MTKRPIKKQKYVEVNEEESELLYGLQGASLIQTRFIPWPREMDEKGEPVSYIDEQGREIKRYKSAYVGPHGRFTANANHQRQVIFD